MSLIGTKRTCRDAAHMSAFGGKADISQQFAAGPSKIRSVRVALLDFQEVPEAPEAQEAQRDPGDLPGLLLRPALLDLQRQGHLYRPLLPRDLLVLEALQALQALQVPETSRNHSTQASSPKLRPTIFFA
jgi:hypothetical protein